jgi:hypothetical protein
MSKLHILWTNDNKEAFLEMAGLYAYNSKNNGWWDEVNVIVWGPSAKLAAEDPQIQTELMELKSIGVTLEACRNCTDNYNVTEKFEKMGFRVDYMGKDFTKYLKAGDKVLTI